MPVEAGHCLGYQTLTAGTAASSGTMIVPSGASSAKIQAGTSAVYYREDAAGTVLTNTTGGTTAFKLAANATADVRDINQFHAVTADNAIPALVHVLYY